jgi:hypothetical protein
VAALPATITRPFGIGDVSLRAWAPLRQTVLHLIETEQIEAVLITGSPFYPMLLAREIRRRFGTPVVLDFQDPWVSAWGERQPRFSKSGVSHWLATRLEPRALRSADFITSVSEVQNAEMARRYPWLNLDNTSAIPIGGDPCDFAALREAGTGEATEHLAPHGLNISYVGTLWPPVLATVRVVLKALAQVRSRYPRAYDNLRLNFIGTTARTNGRNEFRARPLAEAEGVAGAVYEVPHRLPYMTALAITARSDVNLLIGSDEPHYTASKIYPALMSGRPYLSVFHRASSAHAILNAAGGGLAYSFGSSDDLAELEPSIADGLVQLATAPATLGRADPSAYEPYHARAIARRFAAVFDRLVTERAR